MRPKKTETAVHGCLIHAGVSWFCACVRCWCNVCPPFLKLSINGYTYFRQFDCEKLTLNLYLLAKELKWSSPHFVKRKEALLVTNLLPFCLEHNLCNITSSLFSFFFFYLSANTVLFRKEKVSGNSSLRDNSLAKTFARKS